MILGRPANDDDIKSLLPELCNAFPGATWIVFRPQFIDLGTEAEYEAREIAMGQGESAFLLSSRELRALVLADAIGFDWTDLRICNESAPFLYLQCVDAMRWYAKTDSDVIRKVLLNFGFMETDLESLPFPEQLCP
jgi:hypothetical protein